MYTTDITHQQIIQLSSQAYDTAKAQGFYTDRTNITTALMLIITEMAEAVQADRKNKHGSIDDYESWLGTSEEHAYEYSLEGTVESEFSDIAIRILSLLGWYNDKHPVEFYQDTQLLNRINLSECKFTHDHLDLPRGLFRILSETITLSDAEYNPDWVITDLLQDTLCQVLALANYLGIDIISHIHLKMQYNEYRDHLHGYKY